MMNLNVDFEVVGRNRGQDDEAVAAYDDVVTYLRNACSNGRNKFIVDVAVLKFDVKKEMIEIMQKNGLTVFEANREGDLLTVEVE